MVIGAVVRTAIADDLEAVIGVQGVCQGAPQWSEGIWRGLLAGVGAVQRVVFVAELDAALVGFVVAGFVAGLGEIESVAVAETMRRQGIGRRLCEAAMRWAQAEGAETMELEVRASGGGAMRLYTSLGFMECGRRQAYYREPVEDAVLMQVSLMDEAVGGDGGSGSGRAKV